MKLTKQEKIFLLGILETIRIDAILDDNEQDQDCIGLLMAKLGDKDMKSIHVDEV